MGAVGWGNQLRHLSSHDKGTGRSMGIQHRDLASIECLQIAMPENFWDTWSHSSAQLFLPKQGTPAEDSVQATNIRTCVSCPNLYLDLPLSHHVNYLFCLKCLVSAYWYHNGSLCLRTGGLCDLCCQGWMLTGIEA